MSRHIVIHVFVLIITEATIIIKKSYQNPNDKTKYRTDNYGGNTKELLMPNIQNTSQKKKEPIPQYTRMGNTYSVNMPSRIPAKFRSKYSPKITAKPIKMISIVDCK